MCCNHVLVPCRLLLSEGVMCNVLQLASLQLQEPAFICKKQHQDIVDRSTCFAQLLVAIASLVV
jgi:hypothetical protein